MAAVHVNAKRKLQTTAKETARIRENSTSIMGREITGITLLTFYCEAYFHFCSLFGSETVNNGHFKHCRLIFVRNVEIEALLRL